jgi:DNA polymerase-3 subunit alpha
MKTKRGDTMAILQIDDRSARIEVTIYAETYNEHRELLSKDNIVIVEGTVAHDDYSGGLAMRVKEVRSLLQARQNFASELTIEVSREMLDEHFTAELEKTLANAGGGTCPVALVYSQPHNRARVRLGERWQVVPSDELIQALRDCVGNDRVSLQYH